MQCGSYCSWTMLHMEPVPATLDVGPHTPCSVGPRLAGVAPGSGMLGNGAREGKGVGVGESVGPIQLTYQPYTNKMSLRPWFKPYRNSFRLPHLKTLFQDAY